MAPTAPAAASAARTAAEAAAKTVAFAEEAALEKEYVEAMKPLRFQEQPLLGNPSAGYYFRGVTQKGGSGASLLNIELDFDEYLIFYQPWCVKRCFGVVKKGTQPFHKEPFHPLTLTALTLTATHRPVLLRRR